MPVFLSLLTSDVSVNLTGSTVKMHPEPDLTNATTVVQPLSSLCGVTKQPPGWSIPLWPCVLSAPAATGTVCYNSGQALSGLCSNPPLVSRPSQRTRKSSRCYRKVDVSCPPLPPPHLNSYSRPSCTGRLPPWLMAGDPATFPQVSARLQAAVLFPQMSTFFKSWPKYIFSPVYPTWKPPLLSLISTPFFFSLARILPNLLYILWIFLIHTY